MKRIMKFVAFMGVLSMFYPIVMLLRDLAFKTDGGVRAFLLFLFVALIGFAAGTTIIRIQKIPSFIAYVAFILPATCGFLIYKGFGIARLLLEIPVLSVTYLIGLRAGIYNYRHTLSNKKIYAGILLLSSCILVISLVDGFHEHLRTVFFICAFVHIMVSFIIQNQSNLDDAFTGRITDLPYVPRNVRIYNIMVVLIFFAAIIAMFNFQSIVVFLLNVIRKVAAYVIIAILWLFEKLTFPSGESPGDASDIQPLEPLPFEEGRNSIISTIIASVLTILIALFLLYKFAPVIARKIRKLLLAILEALRKFFRTLPVQETDGNEDYYDKVEFVKPDEIKTQKAVTGRKKRNLERELRRLSNPAEKVRLIYGYLLEVLLNAGVAIKKSDTAREIYKKVMDDREALSKADSLYGPFDKVTAVYEKVRYGDYVPDLKEVAQLKKKNR
ncbi:MAG TPA: DUF4129 domain-containing protein [Clostridiaceae bacterium]|nr:DUF4129 domain-containing protein [Clostridiaceae bacterium]